MSLRTALQKTNRTLLELKTGIVILGLLGLVITACFASLFKEKTPWMCLSWVFGTLTAQLSASDMYRVLDRALDLPEKRAQRTIYLGYLKRYVILGILLVIFCLSEVLDPIVFFISYMTLKLAAYMQPLTHKMYNAWFGEKDPPSISQEEYDALHPELVPENEKNKDRQSPEN